MEVSTLENSKDFSEYSHLAKLAPICSLAFMLAFKFRLSRSVENEISSDPEIIKRNLGVKNYLNTF